MVSSLSEIPAYQHHLTNFNHVTIVAGVGDGIGRADGVAAKQRRSVQQRCAQGAVCVDVDVDVDVDA